MFSKKATKINEIFTGTLTICIAVKSTVKILPFFVAFLESTNFIPSSKKSTKKFDLSKGSKKQMERTPCLQGCPIL